MDKKLVNELQKELKDVGFRIVDNEDFLEIRTIFLNLPVCSIDKNTVYYISQYPEYFEDCGEENAQTVMTIIWRFLAEHGADFYELN